MRRSRSSRCMGRWATRSPAHDPSMPLSATSLMLSFRTMGDPARMRGPRRADRLPHRRRDLPASQIADGRMTAERGPTEGADLVFTGPAPAIAGAVYGGVPIEALEAEGALEVEGDRALAARFVTLFPLPPKARRPAERRRLRRLDEMPGEEELEQHEGDEADAGAGDVDQPEGRRRHRPRASRRPSRPARWRRRRRGNRGRSRSR